MWTAMTSVSLDEGQGSDGGDNLAPRSQEMVIALALPPASFNFADIVITPRLAAKTA